MSDKEERENRYFDFVELTKSADWHLFTDFLEGHKEHLQEKVNTYLRSKEYEEARINLALMDECNTLLEVFNRHGQSLKEKAEEKDG